MRRALWMVIGARKQIRKQMGLAGDGAGA